MINMLSQLREWHETQIIGFQKSIRLDDYHMYWFCLLYTSPSPRDQRGSRMAACA